MVKNLACNKCIISEYRNLLNIEVCKSFSRAGVGCLQGGAYHILDFLTLVKIQKSWSLFSQYGMTELDCGAKQLK